MKIIKPDYYDNFHCIADRCRHNCCIGWEIDIDEVTLELYENIPGEFGERLRSGITCGDTPSFKLGEGERCVFLNERGLCDIILNLGEDALCDICTEHPRFRNCFSDRTEMGLGLCCEEACRLILGRHAPVKLIEMDFEDGKRPIPAEVRFFDDRQHMFDILQDRSLTMPERFTMLSKKWDLPADELTPAEWTKFYRGLERLDPKWEKYLDILGNGDSFTDPDDDPIWENLAVYIVYRHAADHSIYSSAAFGIHTVKLICTLCKAVSADFEMICDICRMWSCEIEYSEENTAAVIERLTD